MAVWPSYMCRIQGRSFVGPLQEFEAQDHIYLPNIVFGAQTTLAYATNSGGTGGLLTVTDGRHAAGIASLGNYMAASFVITGDGHGGTPITPAQQAELQPRVTTPASELNAAERPVAPPASALRTSFPCPRVADRSKCRWRTHLAAHYI